MTTLDRGEKIIALASELLDDSHAGHEPPKQGASLRMLCLTTILATFCSSTITEVIAQTSRPINRYERIELDALVYYVAREQQLDETQLRHKVEKQFSVISLSDLTQHEFQLARRFLQDEAQ